MGHLVLLAFFLVVAYVLAGVVVAQFGAGAAVTVAVMVFLVALAVVFVMRHLVSIPAAHVAVPTMFGKRWRNDSNPLFLFFNQLFGLPVVMREGLSFILPFEGVDLIFPEKPEPKQIKFPLTLKDRLAIITHWTIRWQPDIGILNSRGEPRFVEITEKLLDDGLRSTIESEIGRFGGVHNYNDFIEHRREVERFMDCIFRLEKPPHVDPEKILNDFLEKEEYAHLKERLEGLTPDHGGKEVPLEDRLSFYRDFSGPIGDLLREEENFPESRSEAEIFYGINLFRATLDRVEFSEETQQAFEAKRRAEYEIEAIDLKHAKQQEIAADRRKYVSASEAEDGADALMGIAEKKSISIPGLKGLSFNVNLGSGDDNEEDDDE